MRLADHLGRLQLTQMRSGDCVAVIATCDAGGEAEAVAGVLGGVGHDGIVGGADHLRDVGAQERGAIRGGARERPCLTERGVGPQEHGLGHLCQRDGLGGQLRHVFVHADEDEGGLDRSGLVKAEAAVLVGACSLEPW